MTRRTRTAKKLAQRIDLSYFKRPHPFRRLRLALSIAAPAAALLWLGSLSAAGSKAPYSSGPVASAHASFGQRCEVCHVTPASGFRAHVSDTACMACHDAPKHKMNETFTPACASCHLEHRGRVQLAAVGDRFCLQCHEELTTTTGVPSVASRLGHFSSGHPEFAATRGASADRTALRFNHRVHLKTDLRSPSGPTTLECEACHQPAATPGARGLRARGLGARGLGARGLGARGLLGPACTDTNTTGGGAGLSGRRAESLTYEQQCASCHPLYFDSLIDRPAPHEKPEAVREHVTAALREYIAARPEQIGRPDHSRGRIPVNFPVEPQPAARTAGEWVDRRLAAAERLLWGKTCRECHASSPKIDPPNMPEAWMPHARFDHRAHQLVQCESCHRARESAETSDVLMPSIATCRQCHAPDDGAESRCFECHEYHDWTKAKPVKPRFTLEQLTGAHR